MRQYIDLIESAKPTITEIIQHVRDTWLNNGDTIQSIQNGNCFDFADDVVDYAKSIGMNNLMPVALGSFFRYTGKYDDEPEGFDEELLRTHWFKWHPIRGLTWQQMYERGFDWDGIHAWVVDQNTQICYDAYNVEGVSNPFDLEFFKPYVADALNG